MRTIFINIKLIWQGWRNWILDLISDIKYKRYFEYRYNICKSCDHNKMSICEKCGCFTKAKSMAEDAECPVGKWKTIPEMIKNNILHKQK